MPEQLMKRKIRNKAAGLFSESGGLRSLAPGKQLVRWLDGAGLEDWKARNREDALGLDGCGSPEAVAFLGEDTEEGRKAGDGLKGLARGGSSCQVVFAEEVGEKTPHPLSPSPILSLPPGERERLRVSVADRRQRGWDT